MPFPGLGPKSQLPDMIEARERRLHGILPSQSSKEHSDEFPGIQPDNLLVSRERTIIGELIKALMEGHMTYLPHDLRDLDQAGSEL